MSDQLTIIVAFNGPTWIKDKSYVVPFVDKATVHDALMAAYDLYHAGDTDLSFDVVYYGKGLGNFLQSLCGVPTTKVTSWEIFIDDVPAQTGIDSLLEAKNERVRFSYVFDKDEAVAGSAAAAKRPSSS